MTRKSVQPQRKGRAFQRSWVEKPASQSPLAKGACRWGRADGTKESIALLPAHLAPSRAGAGSRTGARGGEQPVSTAHSTLMALKRTQPGDTRLVQVRHGTPTERQEAQGMGRATGIPQNQRQQGPWAIMPGSEQAWGRRAQGTPAAFPSLDSAACSIARKQFCQRTELSDQWGYCIDYGWSFVDTLYRVRICS